LSKLIESLSTSLFKSPIPAHMHSLISPLNVLYPNYDTNKTPPQAPVAKKVKATDASGAKKVAATKKK